MSASDRLTTQQVNIMSYLIDGYNLIHALGLIPTRTGPKTITQARQRLLGLLRSGLGKEESARVTVVFDSAVAHSVAGETCYYHEIQIRFAGRKQEADDLIETLISQDSAPKHLRVVSDDHRIQKAARSRNCQVVGCSAFLDDLESRFRKKKQPPAESDDAKPQRLSETETQHWLREFGSLADDPDWKALSDLYDFGEAEEH